MTSMKAVYGGLMGAILGAIFAEPSAALVLCKSNGGALALRAECPVKETQVDATTLLQALQVDAGTLQTLPCPPDAVKV
jgi:hypothetical protein